MKSGQRDATGGSNEVGVCFSSSGERVWPCWLDGSATIFPLSLTVRDSEADPREELSQVPGYIAVNGPSVNPQLERAVGKAARVGWLSVTPSPSSVRSCSWACQAVLHVDVVCLFHVRR